jgi:hypothetical protein
MQHTVQIGPAQAGLLVTRIRVAEQAAERAKDALELLTADAGLAVVRFVSVSPDGALVVEDTQA